MSILPINVRQLKIKAYSTATYNSYTWKHKNVDYDSLQDAIQG